MKGEAGSKIFTSSIEQYKNMLEKQVTHSTSNVVKRTASNLLLRLNVFLFSGLSKVKYDKESELKED